MATAQCDRVGFLPSPTEFTSIVLTQALVDFLPLGIEDESGILERQRMHDEFWRLYVDGDSHEPSTILDKILFVQPFIRYRVPQLLDR